MQVRHRGEGDISAKLLERVLSHFSTCKAPTTNGIEHDVYSFLANVIDFLCINKDKIIMQKSCTKQLHNAWNVNFSTSFSALEPQIKGASSFITLCARSVRSTGIFFIFGAGAVSN